MFHAKTRVIGIITCRKTCPKEWTACLLAWSVAPRSCWNLCRVPRTFRSDWNVPNTAGSRRNCVPSACAFTKTAPIG